MSSNCHRSDEFKSLWEKLKKADTDGDLYLNIEVVASQQAALLLGLRKQSLKDKAFRFKCIEKSKSFTIGYNSLSDTLQLYLKWRPYVTNAFAGVPSKRRK